MQTRAIAMDNRHGRDVLLVVAKLSFTVSAGGRVALAAEPRRVRVADEWSSGRRWSSLRLPSDFVAEKPGTDVLFVGTAYPPDATSTSFDTSVRVESGRRSLHKTVRVFGPRVSTRGPCASCRAHQARARRRRWCRAWRTVA